MLEKAFVPVSGQIEESYELRLKVICGVKLRVIVLVPSVYFYVAGKVVS